MTSKTRRVMYRCVVCTKEMPSEEKVTRKVRFWGKAVRKEFTQDVCIGCAEAELEGKDAKEAKPRSGSSPTKSRRHAGEDVAA